MEQIDIKDYFDSQIEKYNDNISKLTNKITKLENGGFWTSLFHLFPNIKKLKREKVLLLREIETYKVHDSTTKLVPMEEEIEVFAKVINENRVAYAWNDLNNQLLTTIFSLIFSVIIAISTIYKLLKISPHSPIETLTIIFKDRFTGIIYVLLIFLTIYAVFFQFLSRKLFSVREFFIYINPDIKSRGVSFPPNSKLTYIRGFILAYAVVFMVWTVIQFDKIENQLKSDDKTLQQELTNKKIDLNISKDSLSIIIIKQNTIDSLKE
ncbi:MAG: hypothetical protein MRY57_00910 [Candidatus Pacebacteria bacterium]|nr:hypothetical protein [Candidatus Paceibacterota bacterium]